MTRVKFLIGENTISVETEVNNWLITNQHRIIEDIQFRAVDRLIMVMIIHREDV